MTTESIPIHVVGIGLSGLRSLLPAAITAIQSADLLVGAQRHLSAVEPITTESQPETWALGDLSRVLDDVKAHLQHHPKTHVVVLATGDPLFFGIGRLLLSMFPAEQLSFHPQLSAVQLAFSRLKVPWQDATLVSVHGRGEALLSQALKRGDQKIAILTDNHLTPQSIYQLIESLDLPIYYQMWVCENLGGDHTERVSLYNPNDSATHHFATLNVVILLRHAATPIEPSTTQPLPLIGLPDSVFKGYSDRPTLMTKREIRLMVLGAIAPINRQVIWDIGAGTGSVSIELSRLCPDAHIYAIEKSAMGVELVKENARRLAIAPIHVVKGQAPNVLSNLPKPNRVFIGGSSGQLINILNALHSLLFATNSAQIEPNTEALERTQQLSSIQPTVQSKSTSQKLDIQNEYDLARVVLALTTFEHIAEVTTWLNQPHIRQNWQPQYAQFNIARSLPVGSLTRLSPLNPVTTITLVQRTLC